MKKKSIALGVVLILVLAAMCMPWMAYQSWSDPDGTYYYFNGGIHWLAGFGFEHLRLTLSFLLVMIAAVFAFFGIKKRWCSVVCGILLLHGAGLILADGNQDWHAFTALSWLVLSALVVLALFALLGAHDSSCSMKDELCRLKSKKSLLLGLLVIAVMEAMALPWSFARVWTDSNGSHGFFDGGFLWASVAAEGHGLLAVSFLLALAGAIFALCGEKRRWCGLTCGYLLALADAALLADGFPSYGTFTVLTWVIVAALLGLSRFVFHGLYKKAKE